MIEIDATHVVARFERVMFRWSPCYINMQRVDDYTDSVLVIVRDLKNLRLVNYTIEFFTGVTEYELDISAALQTMSEDVLVIVRTSGHAGQANIFNVNGARSMLAPFGGEFNVRRWEGYSLLLPVMFDTQTTVLLGRRGHPVAITTLTTSSSSGVDLSTFTADRAGYFFATGLVYSAGELVEGSWAFRVVDDCTPKKPIYLRWLDNTGLSWYWLFEVVDVGVRTSEGVEYGRSATQSLGYINEWTTERNTEVNQTAKIVTNNVTKEEYNVLKSLLTSSVVDAYDEASGAWYRVRVPLGEYSEPNGNYKEFEATIEFAPTKSQLL